MDEKVLSLLIERVEKSAQMVQLLSTYNNEEWVKCLEDDKNRLKDYCLKKRDEVEFCDYRFLDKFKFEITNKSNYIYTAERNKTINGMFKVAWEERDNSSPAYTSVATFSEQYVYQNIENGTWKIVEV